MKGWKTIFQANGLKKQAGVAILILNKINFQPKVIEKDKEGYFILIKGKTYQDELSILNIYAPSTRASTLIKEKKLLLPVIFVIKVGNLLWLSSFRFVEGLLSCFF